MTKRLVAPFMITIALFLFVGGAIVSAEESIGFSDVSEEGTHYDGIMSLTKENVITGFEDGTFKPYDQLTREHMAVILYRANKLDVPEDVAAVLEEYSDIDSSNYYAKEIAAVTDAEIFQGVDGTFAPSAPITRQQMATLLVRSMGLERYNPDEDVTINLKSVSEPHQKNVQIFANLELTDQLDDFRPGEDISRGAVASFLYRAQQVGFDLSVLHMNDTHGHVDKMPKMVTAIEEQREQKPNSLLLHGGDVFSGTLYFTEFEGQADVKQMNLMDFDAMVFGNHEFDLGESPKGHRSLAKFIQQADFPLLGTNTDLSEDSLLSLFVSKQPFTTSPRNGTVYDGIVKEVDGEKIGIFGLTTEDTIDIASPVDVTFNNYIEEAERAVAQFEDMGINKIIAVTHIGFDSNKAVGNDLLLGEVDGIDIIVGGHSHTELHKPVVVAEDADGNAKDPTIIVQAGEYVKNLGTLDVEFNDDGVVVGHTGELIKIGDQVDDPQAMALLQPYADEVETLMEEESGAIATKKLENPRQETAGVGSSVRANETPLGNLITDGMLKKAQEFNPDTVIAMQNGGGIRTFIDKGPITIGKIMEVLPFGNTLSLVELSGAEIKAVLEHSVSNAPGESGGFLHVSGMKFTFDSSEVVGERVKSMHLQDGDDYVDIDKNQKYIVTTNAFTARGGDGFDMLKEAYENGRVNDLGASDWKNFREYLVELGTVDPVVEDRIVDLAIK